MSKGQVLIIDDEPDIRHLLAMTLARMDIDCVTAGTLTEAHAVIDHEPYFLCLADMRLPDGDGIEFVEFLQHSKPNLPVAVITAYGNVEGAVNTLKAGAFDYVSKPIDLQMLKDLVNTARTMYEHPQQDTLKDELIGDSPCMHALRQKIQKLSRSQAPVFISGESGVGKEKVAKQIHFQGPRAAQAFVPVNCGAIPGELLESEFFGHKKGSFTGAHADKKGLFASAHGGTLFLDEIADLPLNMQVKLLRAIQEKTIRPIGCEKEVAVDVRILSASHKNLSQLIEVGEFREDLYYRINVIELSVPRLRERQADIEALSQYLLAHNGHQNMTLSDDALAALKQYHFAGNVRELENILERAATLCDSNLIANEDLQLPKPRTTSPASHSKQTLDNYLDEEEKDRIMIALEETRWNKTAAAKILGISFRALRYRLKKYNIS